MTFLTGMVSSGTVTMQLAVKFPSRVVTVTDADPVSFATTTPFATNTTVESEELHMTF